jgi:hypothetical protein
MWIFENKRDAFCQCDIRADIGELRLVEYFAVTTVYVGAPNVEDENLAHGLDRTAFDEAAVAYSHVLHRTRVHRCLSRTRNSRIRYFCRKPRQLKRANSL